MCIQGPTVVCQRLALIVARGTLVGKNVAYIVWCVKYKHHVPVTNTWRTWNHPEARYPLSWESTGYLKYTSLLRCG